MTLRESQTTAVTGTSSAAPERPADSPEADSSSPRERGGRVYESAAHDRGVPKDCDFRGGWHPPPLLGLDRRNLWSGECRTTGANVQILVLLDGGFARAPGLYPELCMTWPPRAPSGLLEELDLSGADR